MNKIRLVALEEIRRTVFKKSFIFVLLSLPLFIAMMIVPGVLMESLARSDLPVGYVDFAGVFAEPRALPQNSRSAHVSLNAFVDEAAAAAALDGEEIQAYYVLHEDYLQSRRVELVYRDEPASEATGVFYDYLQLNLLDEFDYDVAWRAADRSQLTIRNPEGTRLFPEGAPPLGTVIPLALGLAFGGLMMMGGGSLMSGLIDERSNRTIEVIATSISPSRLVTGKLIGIITINFIQLAFWILVGVGAIWLAGDVFDVEWFQNPTLDWPGMLKVTAVSVPGYVFAAALMFGLGATVMQLEEGQAIGPLLFMVVMIPIYSLIGIANNPHGALAVVLTLLPMTSNITVGLRNALAVIPDWQIILSVAIQSACAVGAIWLAGRAFRMGMLRYGKRVRLREILRRASPLGA
jgi:ABC-2 type transport system permease protein